MRKITLILAVMLMIVLPGSALQAQQGHEVTGKKSKSEVWLGADLVSRYVWRGMLFGGNSPSLQPYFTYKIKGFEAGAWGAFSLSGSNYSEEVDLHVSQSFAHKMFTVTLTDYFFPTDTGCYNYFQYGKNTTGHILEGTFAYNGTEKFPLTVLVATNFYGADAVRTGDDPASPDFNKKTGIQYSTYFELGYPFSWKGIDFNTFIGFNATTPKKANPATGYLGETGFYGNGFGVVNLGFKATKAIPITKKYALPVMVSLMTNPQAGKIYFVFGISF